jgi:hypothetical protein
MTEQTLYPASSIGTFRKISTGLSSYSMTLPIIAGLLSATILIVRASDAFLAPNFWAEDGAFFWYQMETEGFFVSFFHPFAGYLHFYPRILAGIVSLFSPFYAPFLYAVATAITAFWIGVTIATCKLPGRMAFWFAAVWLLVPHPNGEVFANIANSQWVLAPALALILLTPKPNSRAAYINQIVFVAMVGFSGPFAAVTLPLSLWRLWHSRDLIAFVSVGLAFVATTVAHFNYPVYFQGTPEPLHLIKMILIRTFPENWPTLVASVAMLAVAVAVPKGRALRVGFIVFAALVLSAAVVKYWKAPESFDSPHTTPEFYFCARYFFIPKVLTLWIAISLIYDRGRARYLAAIWIVLFLATYPIEFFWRAPRADTHWHDAVASMKEGLPYHVVLSPPPWAMNMPSEKWKK